MKRLRPGSVSAMIGSTYTDDSGWNVPSASSGPNGASPSRHRGTSSRSHVVLCEPYDEHDGSLKTSGKTELTRSDWRSRRPEIGSVITEGSPKSSEVLMSVGRGCSGALWPG